ncbi:phage tail tape measure protein [Brevundimonas intermedia]|uniref:Phage tail tape measure protein n=1 Tax=Brevundimonas intermedia TaxID=74315 RepID=A0ABQ5TC01_9CAUL|nr:phage tail tape measure protein [Brevundimonas intermedia]GLK49604.1 phage tail tape measure protein [Brevundimonas intermedia]
MDKKLRLDLIFRAAGNAVGFLKGVSGESAKAAQGVKAARDRITELQRATKNVQAYRTMETRLGATRAAMEAARSEAARLGKAHSDTERPTKQMTRALEVQRTKIRELQAQEQGQIRALAEMRTKMRDAGLDARNLAGSEAKLARQTRDANDALRDQARRLTEVGERQRRMQAARSRYDRTQGLAGTMMGAGASAVGAGTVAAAPLVASGNEAVNFEDAMLDVKKVVDFDTPMQFQQMNRDVLQLAEDLNQVPEGMAAIIAAAGQAKIPRRELLGFAEDAGKMGVAFTTTAEDAGAKMATWRTAFAMTQPQVKALADQINYLGDNGNATALKISDVVTRVGPLGEVAGLAAAQIAALGSTIVGMGVEEEIAATSIKNTMLAMTKGEAATKAQKEAYSALGLEAVAVSKAMQRDAGGAIMDVMTRISRLSPDRQASILTQLFGSESVSGIAPMLTQLGVLKTNLDAVADASLYAGSMQKEFENRQSGAKTAIGQSKIALQGLAIEVGTNFLPLIKAASAATRGAARGIRTFSQAHPNAVKVVAALVAVVAAGLVVFGGLAMAVAAVLGPFALLQLTLTQAGLLFGPVIAGLTGTGAAAGGAAVGVSALLWPVLLVVAAVAALAASAFLIYRNWGTIGPWLSKMWTNISSVVQGALRLVAGYIMNFTPLGFIIRNWQPITNFMGALWGFVSEAVGLGVDSIKLHLLMFTPLGLIMRNWGGITGYVGGVWSQVQSGVSIGIAAIKSVIANFQPLNDFKAAFASVWTYFQELPGRLMNAGADAMRGFTQGIRGQRSQVQAAAADAAGRAETGARNRLDTHSPSRVFAAIGQDVMAGMGVGILGGTGRVVGRMRAAAAAVAAAGALTAPGAATAGVGPTITFQDPPPFLPGPPPGPRGGPPPAAGGGMSIAKVEIHIHQLPGESSEDLVAKVAEKMISLQQGNTASYEADPDSYGD